MHDRRNYQRFSLENNIFLKFESDPEKTIEGKLLDISFVGLSIFLKESVNVDALAQGLAQFDVPCLIEQHLVGKGKIIHLSKHRLYAQNGFRLGLVFIEVDKEIVLNIINQLRSKILDQIRKKSQIPRKKPGSL